MILYLLGIVVVLFLRPTVMFHPDGRWKEFDLQTETGTLFPVWLFCIVWAVVCYFLVSLVVDDDDIGTLNIATTAAATAALSSAPHTPTARVAAVVPPEEAADENLVQALPTGNASSNRKNKKNTGSNLSGAAVAPNSMKPGYYKLNTAASQRNGVPRYIYVGEDIPSEEED